MSSAAASSIIIKIGIGTLAVLSIVGILTYYGIKYYKSMHDNQTAQSEFPDMESRDYRHSLESTLYTISDQEIKEAVEVNSKD